VSKQACRELFSQEILKKAKEDSSIYVLCTDSRGSAKLEKFAEEVPNQYVEVGIAEQNAIGVAAGLAITGMKPFVVGPAAFYSSRASEQVKVDLAYSNNNVKVIAISGGISYGALGATHHSTQDIALMRAIPNLDVIIPSDANQMRALVTNLLKSSRPAYVRIGRGAVEDIYSSDIEFEIGKSVCLRDGKDIAIIACGQMVTRALELADLLWKKNISARVIDMHTIKPLDQTAILSAVKDCGAILTMEEHSVYGGLGGAVAEIVVQNSLCPIHIAALPDVYLPNGEDYEVLDALGLSATALEERAYELIARKA
jgi:transketolase